MVTSLKNLKSEIDNRLAEGGLTSLACCQLQNAETLANNVVYSVANTASLPDNLANEGRLVYVEDIKEYRLANDVNWTDDFTSNVINYKTELYGWGGNCCGNNFTCLYGGRCYPIREGCSATDWCQVSIGRQTGAVVNTSGEIWSIGGCGTAVAGTGLNATHICLRREWCNDTNWCKVSILGASAPQAYGLKTDGSLWASGRGQYGVLATGATIDSCTFSREICSATDWCAIGLGYGSGYGNHQLAIKTSGELWSWGSNAQGSIGDGTTTDKCSPVREFCSATNWCQVTVGKRISAAIKTSGELWAWGLNNYGQIGDGTTTNTCSPVREFCSATDWCFAAGGGNSFISIKTDGSLWGWGRNFSGMLGDGTTTNTCSPVREFCSATDWCFAATEEYSASAIKTDGTLWSWGYNACGVLGICETSAKCSPVQEVCKFNSWCNVSMANYSSAAIRTVAKGFLE